MTMGIVLVACLAAWIAPAEVWDDKNIDLELHELGYEAWDAVTFSLGAAKLDHKVFSSGCSRDLAALGATPRRKAQDSMNRRFLGGSLSAGFRRLLRRGHSSTHCERDNESNNPRPFSILDPSAMLSIGF